MEKVAQILSEFGFAADVEFSLNNSTLESLSLAKMGFSTPFWMQRDDLIHPVISGNKWRKLEGWVRYAKHHEFHTLVTFGGAFSNHLVATAAAGHLLGFKTIGLLRADEPITNHYLEIAQAYGMEIRGVSRELYREKSLLVSEYETLEGHLVIPEGGQGELAFEGFQSLVASWGNQIDVVFHASATATTAVGLALAIKQQNLNIKVKAVLVLKNLQAQLDYAQQYDVQDYIEFITGYEFGGYAKTSSELLKFNDEFEIASSVKIDPVYTAKALWTLREKLPQNEFKGQRVAFLHTGGMLGRYSDKFVKIGGV